MSYEIYLIDTVLEVQITISTFIIGLLDLEFYPPFSCLSVLRVLQDVTALI